MLYLVATPIGNLSDITFRAIEILKSVDYILCEDTRHSAHLLKHYEISKPLVSYHSFSEAKKLAEILDTLREGKQVALISDAGTPGISDPGTMLVQACVKEGITVMAIPGPCAAIAAISTSGLDTEAFQFIGFLPKKSMELTRKLKQILAYPGTTVCYESPYRLLDVLQVLLTLDPTRQIVVGRELTKKFEEMIRGSAAELMAHWDEKAVKGEIVLLIAGDNNSTKAQDWEEMSVEEHVASMQETFGMSRKEAIVAVAKLRGTPKSQVYKAVHKE